MGMQGNEDLRSITASAIAWGAPTSASWPGFLLAGNNPQFAASHSFVVFRHEGGLSAVQKGADPARWRRLNRIRFILGLVANEHALEIAENHRIVGSGN